MDFNFIITRIAFYLLLFPQQNQEQWLGVDEQKNVYWTWWWVLIRLIVVISFQNIDKYWIIVLYYGNYTSIKISKYINES